LQENKNKTKTLELVLALCYTIREKPKLNMYKIANSKQYTVKRKRYLK
jgi:hypothetical protein